MLEILTGVNEGVRDVQGEIKPTVSPGLNLGGRIKFAAVESTTTAMMAAIMNICHFVMLSNRFPTE